MDKEWEKIILGMVGLVAGMYFLPKLVSKFLPYAVDQAAAQLLSWHIVVPAGAALFEIPGTAVGLDLARILVGCGVILVAGTLGIRALRAQRGSQAR
ncbi:hypothetical protein [Brachybacterium kimchii]|uniref:AzlD domain-containing protein n=1 Tax=Brachybacterium kimchii TaxID=2942909 RepID=A0ABY4NB90_9MICO|nr:hypothetical protein [Brachybacterium kimchii]UQN31802.1 hypothetical protein M4486_19625 [Brachybacterium kimchii]